MVPRVFFPFYRANPFPVVVEISLEGLNMVIRLEVMGGGPFLRKALHGCLEGRLREAVALRRGFLLLQNDRYQPVFVLHFGLVDVDLIRQIQCMGEPPSRIASPRGFPLAGRHARAESSVKDQARALHANLKILQTEVTQIRRNNRLPDPTHR